MDSAESPLSCDQAGEAAPGIFARFADTVMGILVAPRQTLRLVAAQSKTDSSRIAEAGALVTLVCVLDGLRMSWTTMRPGFMLVSMISTLVVGLVMWGSVVAVPAIAEVCLGRSWQKARALAATCGWSFLPWLLMAPLSLYAPAIGPLFSYVVGALIFACMFRLFWMSVQESYELTSEKVFYLVVVVPQLVTVALSLWMWQTLIGAASLIYP